jgi:hypothetical protein
VEKLNYENEDIHVYFVRGKEAPKSREATKALPVPDRRTSKRSRRTSSGNSICLKVSGSTTVYQLKLMIWESLGVCYNVLKLQFFVSMITIFYNSTALVPCTFYKGLSYTFAFPFHRWNELFCFVIDLHACFGL